MEEAKSLLAESFLRVCDRSGTLLCTKPGSCGVGVELRRESMRHHLKTYHTVDTVRNRRLYEAAKKLYSCATDLDLGIKYADGGARHGKLPRLDGLPVKNGKQCVHCDRLFSSDETLRTHVPKKHPGKKLSASAIRSLPSVSCQALRPGCNLFQVAEDISSDGDDKGLQYNPGATAVGSGHDVEDWYKSPFVSVAQVPQRLKSSGLSLANVHLILGRSSPWLSEIRKDWLCDIKSVIRKDLDEAKRLVVRCGQFYNFRAVIQTSGVDGKDRSFKFLEENEEGEDMNRKGLVARDTKQRYVDHIVIVVRIACMVAAHLAELTDVYMNPFLRDQAMKIVHGGMDQNGEDFSSAIFNVLWFIFTEEKTSGEDGAESRIFAYVVSACLCVQHDAQDSPRMSSGSITGSRLAGILYGASCYFALYILRDNPKEGFKEAVAKVQKVTDAQSQHGVCYMTDLRTICSYLREQERKINPFQVCDEHRNCGLFAGKEFSAEQYGDSVRKIHLAVKDIMFKDLLNNKPVPSQFWEDAEDMVEDVDKELIGYWVLSDERNSTFVQKSARWAGKSANLNVLRQYGWEHWKKKAENLLLLLLAALHISGGGPSRGTEIGSLTIRNTLYGNRRVYFPKKDVMILPFYNKTRALKRGKVIFLTRHLDRETSRLLRAFLLLVHPILVYIDEHLTNWDGKQRHPVENVRDSLTLGRWRPYKVADKIGNVFQKFEIPFTFSQFRHHQRGLASSKINKTFVRVFSDAAEAAARSTDGGDGLCEIAQFSAPIEQAGHTARTARMYYAHTRGSEGLCLKSESEKIELFRKASHEWHVDLGLRQKELDFNTKQLQKRSDALHRVPTKGPELVQKIIDRPSTDNVIPVQSDETGTLRSGMEQNSEMTVLHHSKDCIAECTVCAYNTGRENISGCKGTEEGLGAHSRIMEVNLSEDIEKMQEGPGISPQSVRSMNCIAYVSAPVKRNFHTQGSAGGHVTLNVSPEIKISATRHQSLSLSGKQRGLRNNGLLNNTVKKVLALQKQHLGESNISGCGAVSKHVVQPYGHGSKNSAVLICARDSVGDKLQSNVVSPLRNALQCSVPQRNTERVEPDVGNENVMSRAETGELCRRQDIAGSERYREMKALKVSEQASKYRKVQNSDWNRVLNSNTEKISNQSRNQRHDSRRRSDIERRDHDRARQESHAERNADQDRSGKIVRQRLHSTGWNDALNESLNHVLGDELEGLSSIVDGRQEHEADSAQISKRPVNGAKSLPACRVIGNTFNALDALRKVTAPGAQFKSAAQQSAMEAVARRRGDLLIVLATGEGKTAVVMGPVTREVGVTVWVTPLRALRWETERRLQSGGLEVFSLQNFVVTRTKDGVGMVLLVSPEDVIKAKFKQAIVQMSERNSLNRLVIDEAHLAAMAESYRPCFTLLKSAVGYGTLCPTVMLTATAPPSMVKRIVSVCGSDEGGLEVHRGDTCRANLSLRLQYLDSNDDTTLCEQVTQAASVTKARFGREGARIIIVCLTIEHAKSLFYDLLQHPEANGEDILLYHSQRTEMQRDKVMKRWKSALDEGIRVVVATEGFSTGTDSPNVRLVLFAGSCRNIVDFWQGAGRAGRDGGPGDVLVLFHEAHHRSGLSGKYGSYPMDVEKDAGDFGKYARNKRHCRRAYVEKCLTGGLEAPTCFDRLKSGRKVAFCDICSSQQLARSRLKIAKVGTNENRTCFTNVKRPSDSEICKTMAERLKMAQYFQNQRLWLRRVGERLDDLCLHHLLTLFNGKKNGNISFHGSSSMRVYQNIRACRAQCDKKTFRCHRCQSVGHKASECPVFESITVDPRTRVSTGNGACRECRLIAVFGLDPHEDLEFGQKTCPLRACLYLLMRAWDVDFIRSAMLDPREGLQWTQPVPPTNRDDFALWLTSESGAKQAGICSALRWLFMHLPADLGSGVWF